MTWYGHSWKHLISLWQLEQSCEQPQLLSFSSRTTSCSNTLSKKYRTPFAWDKNLRTLCLSQQSSFSNGRTHCNSGIQKAAYSLLSERGTFSVPNAAGLICWFGHLSHANISEKSFCSMKHKAIWEFTAGRATHVHWVVTFSPQTLF